MKIMVSAKLVVSRLAYAVWKHVQRLRSCIRLQNFGRNQRKAKQRIPPPPLKRGNFDNRVKPWSEAPASLLAQGQGVCFACLNLAVWHRTFCPLPSLVHCTLVPCLPQSQAIVMPKPIMANGWFALNTPTFHAFIPDSEAHILSCIDAFQFEPDAEIIFQKDRLELYEQVLEQAYKSRRFMPVNAHVKCWAPITSMQVLAVTSVLILTSKRFA